MQTVFELPMLFGTCKTGKQKVYRVTVTANDDGSFSVLREHGRLGGKMQIDEKCVSLGKNLGRANETFAKDQAIAEAKSYWQKKVDSNYSQNPDPNAPKANLLPMLAQSYKDSGHRIKFPCYAQIKLNGVRCLAKRMGNSISFTSRKGKSYNATLGHLVPTLLAIMQDGEIFDGEIYLHGKSLQTIASYVKRLQPASYRLQFWVYDMANPTMPFSSRYATYSSVIPENPLVFAVPSIEITGPEMIKPVHDQFVQEGYEGLILRNRGGLYEFDHRSADLQKFKEFQDKEFLIVGGKTAETGRYKGSCVFQCVTENGKTFDVCPRGSMEVRQQYYKDLPNLIGKKLTVRYQNFSDDGVPLFPIGVVVRDYE